MVLGFMVLGFEGEFGQGPSQKHYKGSTSPRPNILTPATVFSFPLNVPVGTRATHTRFGRMTARKTMLA